MPGALFGAFKDFWRWLTRRVEINNSEYFDKSWKPYKAEAEKKLGAGSDALKTLRDVESAIGGKSCGRRIEGGIFWHYCRDYCLHGTVMDFGKLVGKGSGIVGDPDDVHHIIPPQRPLGYAIYTSKNGEIVCEIIEGLDKRLYVLRVKGLIMAVQTCALIRHENYRGMHVV